MKIVWQHKDDEPIEVIIDDFIKTQIELCLLGIKRNKVIDIEISNNKYQNY